MPFAVLSTMAGDPLQSMSASRVVVVCVSLPKLPVLRCAAIQLAPTGAGFQGWVRGSGVAQPPSTPASATAQTAAFVDVLLVMSISSLGRGSIPVSYTHLDVYKRQRLR